MNFFEAVSSGFRNYVNFSGRAIRSEYWYWAFDQSAERQKFAVSLLPGCAKNDWTGLYYFVQRPEANPPLTVPANQSAAMSELGHFRRRLPSNTATPARKRTLQTFDDRWPAKKNLLSSPALRNRTPAFRLRPALPAHQGGSSAIRSRLAARDQARWLPHHRPQGRSPRAAIQPGGE